MPSLRDAAVGMLNLSCVLFSALLLWNHLRVRGERRRLGIAEEKPSIRDPRSMHGLVLEGASFLLAFAFARRPIQPEQWQSIASIAFGALSVAVLAAALRHLGLEWRIKAVVTDDHKLVTSGPYAYIRHPIFAALFALLLANVVLLDGLRIGLAAIAIYLYGTEIRIKAEDGLLEQRFGDRFRAYSKRTARYLPFLR